LAQILESLEFTSKIELAILETEKELSEREAQLRNWALNESTELNNEIGQVRVSVENGR
jgi:hypothetical protein